MEKVDTCELCNGTGFMKTSHGTLKLCACRYKNRDINRELNIPKRYWNVSLENYKPMNPSQDGALLVAKKFVQSFNEEEGRGITFVGSPGIGKTHIAVAVLKALYEKKRIKGVFFDTKDLIYRLKMAIDEGKDLKFIKAILNVPVLVLDDLGSERLSDWQRELISYIITYRYNNLKSTIVTTNFNLENEESNVKISQDLSARLGENVVSKLYEVNDLVIMKGEDLRKVKKVRFKLPPP